MTRVHGRLPEGGGIKEGQEFQPEEVGKGNPHARDH